MSAVRVERFAVIDLSGYPARVLDVALLAVERFRREFGPGLLFGVGSEGNACASIQCLKPTDDSGPFVAVLVANPRGLLAILEALTLGSGPTEDAEDRQWLTALISDAIAGFQ